jgi:P27 family predicted phage terminase small subunit
LTAKTSSAAAQLRQAEEAIEQMAKQDPRGHALTIKGSAGNQVTNPLLRIASQARADTQRMGSAFGLTPNGRLRLSGVNPQPSPCSDRAKEHSALHGWFQHQNRIEKFGQLRPRPTLE